MGGEESWQGNGAAKLGCCPAVTRRHRARTPDGAGCTFEVLQSLRRGINVGSGPTGSQTQADGLVACLWVCAQGTCSHLLGQPGTAMQEDKEWYRSRRLTGCGNN